MPTPPPAGSRQPGGELAGIRVGVDLDGVCCDYVAGLGRYLVATGRAAALPPPADYRLREWFATEADRLAAHAAAVAAGLHREAPAIPGAAVGIGRLHRMGAVVVAVSARGSHNESPDRLRADIEEWAAAHGVEFDDVRLGRPKTQAGCDIYVEDSPDDVRALRADGQLTVVFDQPWNRHLPAPRTRGWGALPDQIAGLLLAAGS